MAIAWMWSSLMWPSPEYRHVPDVVAAQRTLGDEHVLVITDTVIADMVIADTVITDTSSLIRSSLIRSSLIRSSPISTCR